MLIISSLSLKSKTKRYLKNPRLQIIKKGFLGNTLVDGTFQNLYGKSDMSTLYDLLKWKLSSNPQKKIKDNEQYKLKVIKEPSILESKKDYICWMGHASFLIQINGKRILTDPCLTAPPLTKRYTELPFPIQDIKPEYLLISHGHYDHLDSDTVKHLHHSVALVPLKMSKLIHKMNPTIITQEAGWYQRYHIAEDFDIYLLPAHHWHKRGLADKDEVLWGSFLIKTKHKSIYFAGDTGYSKHFKDIYKTFGKIDIAILPIGAYAPRWFMRPSHMNPEEALKAYKDLHAKTLIPMHFGTFDLSDEPLGEPEQILRNIGQRKNIHFLTIGKRSLLHHL